VERNRKRYRATPVQPFMGKAQKIRLASLFLFGRQVMIH
jgi:hypothetical protein